MLVAMEVRAKFNPKASSVKLNDFKIPFKRKEAVSEEDKALHQKYVVAIAKARALAMVGGIVREG